MIKELAFQVFSAAPPKVKESLPGVNADGATFERALNIVFAISGGIAVLVITVAGITYALSQGDPTKTSRSKNAIIYAAVGLVVVVLSSTLVNFVFDF